MQFSIKLIGAAFLSMAVCGTFGGSIALADEPEEKMQTVITAKVDLNRGAVVTESNLEEKSIPARFAPMNAVSGAASVVGRKMKVKKSKGQIILIDDLANAGDKLD